MLELKEKDVIQKLPTSDNYFIRAHENNTFCKILKIDGDLVWYNQFEDGVLEKTSINIQGSLADLQDETKYMLSPYTFFVLTIYQDQTTNEVQHTYKYNSPDEALADLGHNLFEFAPQAKDGVVMVTDQTLADKFK